MALPEPRPGLVIRYAYLWRDQGLAGADEAAKDRPCVVGFVPTKLLEALKGRIVARGRIGVVKR